MARTNGPCVFCNKGEVIETEEKDYKVYVEGLDHTFTLPIARVGTCNICHKVNYALKKEKE